MRKFLICLLTFLPAAAGHAEIVGISPQQQRALGIRTAPVHVAASQTGISVLARVTPAPDSRLPVSAPFAGTVKSLLRLEGETVRKGDALASIASADMHAAQARQQSFAARYRSAKAAADRARALVAEGIAPASRAEEANAEAAAAAAELAASGRVMAQVSGKEAGGYRLLAPADGRIAHIGVSVGEQVSAMQPVMALDTRQELWLEGALPASAIGRAAAGDEVMLEGAPDVRGTVVAAGTSIDPKTRSATVRARLTAGAALISGQTVRISIRQRAGQGNFTVPRGAVISMKQGPAVFVMRPGGFEPVTVQLLSRGPQDATVQGRLNANDRVAVAGVTELKAASAQD